MEQTQKCEERLEILKRIDEYEKNGWFDKDVENDPPTIPIKVGEVDYLRKKPKNKINRAIAYLLAHVFFNKERKNGGLVIEKINGLENLKSIKGGAVLTCNHFNPYDCFTMQHVFESAKFKKKRLFKVIREGNYKAFNGLLGYIMRNCDTLPLSENFGVMREFTNAIGQVLKSGNMVLIYPEQSMWWNYKKPKPLKSGAFKFAVMGGVPIVPCFITMQDGEKIDKDGFPVQKYTVNVFPPIYPNVNLPKNERAESLSKQNYEVWVKCYEETYGKLEFLTENTQKR